MDGSMLDQAAGLRRSEQWVLIIVSLGSLMTILDGTIVNVALPSMKAALAFSDASIVWVVNAYLLTFAGLLLLSGRLCDYVGYRPVFCWGIVLFTLASLGCGLAASRGMLIGGRVAQGLGAAMVSAATLPAITHTFTEGSGRARAMGVFVFVSAAGGSLGVLAGGVLTSLLDWHWIFLVNVPIGVAVYVLGSAWLEDVHTGKSARDLDIAGAISLSGCLVVCMYAILGGGAIDAGTADGGGGSVGSAIVGGAEGGTARRVLEVAVAVALLGLFIRIEARARNPLVPLRFLRLPNIAAGNVSAALWSGAWFALLFNMTLLLQRVLGYSPWQVGLVFLPANLIIAVFSLGLSAKVVGLFGTRLPLMGGLLLAAAALLLLAQTSLEGSTALHVLPGLLLFGVGAGIACNPLYLVAVGTADPGESGLASGLVNTAVVVGGALGLSVVAAVAAGHTSGLLDAGVDTSAALAGGYRVGLRLGALFALGAAVAGIALGRPSHAECTCGLGP